MKRVVRVTNNPLGPTETVVGAFKQVRLAHSVGGRIYHGREKARRRFTIRKEGPEILRWD